MGLFEDVCFIPWRVSGQKLRVELKVKMVCFMLKQWKVWGWQLKFKMHAVTTVNPQFLEERTLEKGAFITQISRHQSINQSINQSIPTIPTISSCFLNFYHSHFHHPTTLPRDIRHPKEIGWNRCHMESSRCRNRSKLGNSWSFFLPSAGGGGAKEELVKKNWLVVSKFFIFIPIWGRFPFWLIFFNRVETTN